MKRIRIILGILLLLGLAGCVARPVEQPLPTLAPQKEQEQEASSKETGGEKGNSDGILGILSYVDKSKQAKDENEAEYLKTRLLIACIEAQMEGVSVPKEAMRFRYTADLSEMDDAYGDLKAWLLTAEQESSSISLNVAGNYIMVEIFTNEEGMVSVKTELLHE